jgi:transposase
MAEVLKRRHYSEEFKRESVRMIFESNKPTATIAESIGIDQSNLHKWKKKYAHEFVQKLDAIEDGFIKLSEYELLKQEIASIKETIEVLRNVIKKSVQHNLNLE